MAAFRKQIETKMPRSDTYFQPDNKLAEKHGGERAVKLLQKGEPFDGLALAAYESVISELGVDLDKLSGLDAVLVKRAARFEAVARLFDVAAQAAASEGDVDKWEGYQRRSGWIGGRAFKALGDLRGVFAGDGDIVDYESVVARDDDDE